MKYDFETVKGLFDRFNIKFIDEKYVVIDRKSSIPYYEEELVAGVKFAHTWVKATEYNRSRTTPETQIVTEQDYNYAFNEGAKDTYYQIMDSSQQCLEASGKFYRPEVLEQEVKNSTNYKYSGDIVKGLYQSERFKKSFEDWVRYSTGIDVLYPNNQEQNNEGIRR